MPRPPNYSQERAARDQAKARKKAEKLAAKAAAKERESSAADDQNAPAEPADE